MSTTVVSRHQRTGWYAAGILTTAVVGSGLLAAAGVKWTLRHFISDSSREPLTEKALQVMKDYEFERLITLYYEEKHARTFRNYSSRYDTKVETLQTFVRTAEGPKLDACVALTDVLIKGFCPKDLTDRVGQMVDYKGPWGSTDLNHWVNSLKDQNVTISLVGVEHEVTRPVDWWLLFCGMVEQYEAEITKRCLDDWRSLAPWLKPFARSQIASDPRFLITESNPNSLLFQKISVPPGLYEKTKNLKFYVGELPNVFCDSHDLYSRRHTDFLRSEYNKWCDAGSNSDPPPGGLERRAEDYVRDLLNERNVKVKELKSAG